MLRHNEDVKCEKKTKKVAFILRRREGKKKMIKKVVEHMEKYLDFFAKKRKPPKGRGWGKDGRRDQSPLPKKWAKTSERERGKRPVRKERSGGSNCRRSWRDPQKTSGLTRLRLKQNLRATPVD